MAISDKEQTTQAKDIINKFSIVLRTGNLHSIENDAVMETIIKFQNVANPCIDSEGFLKLELSGEFFYLNDARVRFPLEFLLNFDYLAEEFRKRELGSVTFSSLIDMEDLKTFLRAFMAAVPFDEMVSMIDGGHNIELEKLKKVKETDKLNRRNLVKRTYFNAVSYAKGVMTTIQKGEQVSLRRAKRVIESIVDAILTEEQLIVGMTAIKDYDEYTYHHSVNVSILSVALGQRLRLNRSTITTLGIAALFHDIGKTGLSKEVLNKPSSLNEDEWVIIQRHPYLGALSILKMQGIDEISVQNAITAFQHHMKYDFSGYPKVREPMEMSFYTRIVTIADQFDAMTSSRVYNTNPKSPDEAVRIMLQNSGTELDPVLLKIFINMAGVYPVGSLVLLNTREMGIVYEGSQISPERPKVMISVDSNGERTDAFIVDLTERDSAGRFVRTIEKTLDPKDYNISLAEYLL